MPGYGYQWWILSPDVYAAIGYNGQRIFVLKDKQMVVVFTSQLTSQHNFKNSLLPEGILKGYIIPAVKSNNPLPDNPKALKRLKALDHFWQTTDYAVREKRLKKLKSALSEPKRTLYVNKQLGFSLCIQPILPAALRTPGKACDVSVIRLPVAYPPEPL